MELRYFAALGLILLAPTVFAGPLTFTFDEHGNGWFNGQFVQGSFTVEPASRMTVMTYVIPGLGNGDFAVSGDVIVLDPPGTPTCSVYPVLDATGDNNWGAISNWGANAKTPWAGNCLSDFLRFYGNPGTIYVFSDADEPGEPGFPQPPNNRLFVNLAITSEVGTASVNWVPETLPLGVAGQAQGQPGYTYNINGQNVVTPLGISYVFVSDDTPEPGTLLTLLSSLALLHAWRKRR